MEVVSCQEEIVRLLVAIRQKNIQELASLRFLKPNVEYENTKMGRRTYEQVFFPRDYVLI